MNTCEICGKKATYECEECGVCYCSDDAEEMEYECDCCPQPALVKIRKPVNKKGMFVTKRVVKKVKVDLR